MPRRYALAGFVLLLAACGTPARVASDDALGEAVVVTGPQQALRGAQADAAADRQLVRTASLDVTVDGDDQVTPTVDRAAALAEELGGYVAQRGPSSVLLRVPDDRLDQALDALAALGDAGDREVFTRDVTAAYTDLQIRLDNARALQARLRTLLERADSVPDVLAVERELARVTVEVESLEGQLRLLQNQVAYSTVRLEVRDAVRPGPLGYVFVGLYEGSSGCSSATSCLRLRPIAMSTPGRCGCRRAHRTSRQP